MVATNFSGNVAAISTINEYAIYKCTFTGIASKESLVSLKLEHPERLG